MNDGALADLHPHEVPERPRSRDPQNERRHGLRPLRRGDDYVPMPYGVPMIGKLPIVKQFKVIGVVLVASLILAALMVVLDGRQVAQSATIDDTVAYVTIQGAFDRSGTPVTPHNSILYGLDGPTGEVIWSVSSDDSLFALPGAWFPAGGQQVQFVVATIEVDEDLSPESTTFLEDDVPWRFVGFAALVGGGFVLVTIPIVQRVPLLTGQATASVALSAAVLLLGAVIGCAIVARVPVAALRPSIGWAGLAAGLAAFEVAPCVSARLEVDVPTAMATPTANSATAGKPKRTRRGRAAKRFQTRRSAD